MQKKIFFKNSRGLQLAGTLWDAPSKAIIIMVHGSGSNRLARGLFNNIAQAIQKENINVLAFDFSGHGESEDDIFTIEKAIIDVRSAIDFCKEQGYKKIGLLGHSLGALACLEVYSPDIKTMILLGALTGPVHWKWEDMCSQEQINEMHKTGHITAEVNDGLRKIIKIEGDLLHDIANIDQKKLLGKVTCPVLIIHGDSGAQECDMLKATQEGLGYWQQKPELQIIKGAEHDFLNASDNVIALIKKWLLQYFK